MLELRTGCRIHFGLMELCEQSEHRFSGLGIMLADPCIRLRIRPAAHREIRISSPILDPISHTEYVRRIAGWQESLTNRYDVEVLDAYPFHSGLGAGTQLACLLSIVKQWEQSPSYRLGRQYQPIVQLTDLTTQSLAKLSGRGLRSAIGIQGFLTGGLICDWGYPSLPAISQSRDVQTQVTRLPSTWRVVLIRGTDNSTITGSVESDMIQAIARVENPHRAEMLGLARKSLQAANERDFPGFVACVDRYTYFASEIFAPLQGGRYNGAVCSLAANVATQHGLQATGQSSWGPTIFGWVEGDGAASRIVNLIQQQFPTWNVQAARPAASGAMAKSLIDH